jgi:hypothetical protein
MPRGFAENTTTHTRHRRAAQIARLSLDVRPIKNYAKRHQKKPRKMYSCIHTHAARQKLLRLDALLD